MKPKDLNERQTAFVLALARLISDEKLPADSEEFQLTAGLAAYHLYMAHELGEVPEHM